MTKNYNDVVNENEELVRAMLEPSQSYGEESDLYWKVGYLTSFVANAMYEIPELKERVESRIVQQIKLRALSKKVA